MTQEKKELPIGVFDSGLGGLTVVKEMLRMVPAENIIYLGDNARVPYGTRSRSTVIRYARACSKLLLSKGLKMLVVACNTVSAVALPELCGDTEIPVLGVIEAGARAVARTSARRIGVIGTAGTINSNTYLHQITALVPGCRVFQIPAPMFVPLAEEGWLDGEVPVLVAKRYLRPLVAEEIEVLLLGCTHYPLLVDPIRRSLSELGSKALIIDSATAMASAVKKVLDGEQMSRDPSARGGLRCLVTDIPASFEPVASRFLGNALGGVEEVDIS